MRYLIKYGGFAENAGKDAGHSQFVDEAAGTSYICFDRVEEQTLSVPETGS